MKYFSKGTLLYDVRDIEISRPGLDKAFESLSTSFQSGVSFENQFWYLNTELI